MTLQAFRYWLFIALAAFVVAGFTNSFGADAETILTSLPTIQPVAVPEPSRALFMALGFLAVLFSYRQAWRNFSRKA